MRQITITALLASSLFQAGCSDKPPAPVPAPISASTFDTSIDTRQLMTWVLDPSAQVVFAAVGTITSDKGQEEIQPRTDDEWNTVRNHAAMLLEAGNLLMIEGRARNSLIQDTQDWNAKARALSAAARTAMEATDVKDPEALFDAGGVIYEACRNCHEKYLPVPSTDAPK